MQRRDMHLQPLASLTNSRQVGALAVHLCTVVICPKKTRRRCPTRARTESSCHACAKRTHVHITIHLDQYPLLNGTIAAQVDTQKLRLQPHLHDFTTMTKGRKTISGARDNLGAVHHLTTHDHHTRMKKLFHRHQHLLALYLQDQARVLHGTTSAEHYPR